MASMMYKIFFSYKDENVEIKKKITRMMNKKKIEEILATKSFSHSVFFFLFTISLGVGLCRQTNHK